MRAYLAAAGVLVAIPLFAALQDTHIHWSPTVGEKSQYKVQIDGTMDIPQMGPMDLHFEIITEENIKEITDDKITVGSKMVDMKILIGGNDISEMSGGGAGASEEMKKETVLVYNRKQELISKPDTEAMGGGERAMRLSQFVYPDKPMAIDGSWTLEMKGDKAKNMPPARTKYTFKGTEEISGRTYYRIDYSFSELEGAKPMGAVGVIHLVPATGRIFRVKADVNDAQFDEQMPPTNVKFALQLL